MSPRISPPAERVYRPVLRAAEAGKQAILDLVLPPCCRLCSEPVGGHDDFCVRCEVALAASGSLRPAPCRRCGLPSPKPLETAGSEIESGSAGSGESNGPARCVHCRELEFEFHDVTTLWAYRERVCDAVVAAKYAHQSALADALGRRLGDRFLQQSGEDLPNLVTYVPSHLTRQLSRGGNGNQAIAMAVARRLGTPCRGILRITRRIAKQAWLSDQERADNVRGAFSLKKSYALARPPELAERQVLVVDDVLTTGATANEVARVLRKGGARRVSLAVVARAVRSQ